MQVRVRARVVVHQPAVMVLARRADRALADREDHRAEAEADQHRRDTELEEVGDARRHLRPQHDQHGADDDERAGVAEAPERAEQRGARAAALAGDERGDRRQVIRFERVPHAEERAEAGTGEKLEYWHNDERSLF